MYEQQIGEQWYGQKLASVIQTNVPASHDRNAHANCVNVVRRRRRQDSHAY